MGKKRPRGTSHKRADAALPRRIIRRLDIAIDEDIDDTIATDPKTTYEENSQRLSAVCSNAEQNNDDVTKNDSIELAARALLKRCSGDCTTPNEDENQSKSTKATKHTERSDSATDTKNNFE